MALNSLYCADVPLSNYYALTHPHGHSLRIIKQQSRINARINSFAEFKIEFKPYVLQGNRHLTKSADQNTT